MTDAIKPGEVAERLEAAAEGRRYGTTSDHLNEAASLIRALNERERVLVEAASNLMTLVEPMVRGNTDFSVTWRKYVREMRAALTKAQP